MQSPIEIQVAIEGNDANPGTFGSPLATIEAARKAARRAKGTVNVLLHEGTYYMEKPLVLSAEDSGEAQCPVTYKAADGATVTMSGGRKLDCRWKPFRDGILMCSLPEAADGTLEFTQLFINGRRQVLARFPKRDDSDTENYSGYTRPAGAIPDDVIDPCPDPDADMTYPHQAKRGILFDPATFTDKGWARPDEARIHIYQSYYWGNLQWNIKAIDRENGRIWFGEGGHQLGAQYSHSPMSVDQRSRFFIENVFEELSAPTEWYLDRREGVLYWIPGPGVDPHTAVIEVPRLKTLVEFCGSQREPVHHITFEGVRFACTASTYMDPYEIPSLGDWAIARNGTVLMEGTRNCAIRNIWFDAVGGNAVFVNRYNRNVDITGCTFTETGDSAICFVGEYESTTGTQKPFPYECRAHNNHIHHCGEYGKQIAGVYISRAKRITVSHNLVHDMSRAGICIGDGTWGRHILEYNHVHDTCRQTHDRYFHNITVMSPETVRAEHDFDFKSDVTGNEIYAITLPPAVGPWFEEVDRNCLFNTAGKFVMRIRPRGGGDQQVWGLDKWQKQGFDMNSVFGDPLFVDPANHDYRVRPESPALRVGFKNFEMGNWGLKEKFRRWAVEGSLITNLLRDGLQRGPVRESQVFQGTETGKIRVND